MGFLMKLQRMSDYTPTTEVVRHVASFPRERLGEPRPIKPEAFDRWLEQVRAEAWDEGYTSGRSNTMRRMSDEPKAPLTCNPYRQETDQ